MLCEKLYVVGSDIAARRGHWSMKVEHEVVRNNIDETDHMDVWIVYAWKEYEHWSEEAISRTIYNWSS